MITAGIDIGSSGTKAVLLEDGHIVGQQTIRTLPDSEESGNEVYRLLLREAGCARGDVACVVATGYGRVNVTFADKVITEISCHAKGIHYFYPQVRTILDMGGQDCKAIRCDDRGRVVEFLMNDRCAAGTGRYLERIGKVLHVPQEEIGPRSLQIVEAPAKVSSYCTVFAEGDAVLLVRRGRAINDILAGISDGLVERTCALIGKLGVEPEMAITGGIARNIGIVRRLERELGRPVLVPEQPQIVGALGAALFAAERAARR